MAFTVGLTSLGEKGCKTSYEGLGAAIALLVQDEHAFGDI